MHPAWRFGWYVLQLGAIVAALAALGRGPVFAAISWPGSASSLRIRQMGTALAGLVADDATDRWLFPGTLARPPAPHFRASLSREGQPSLPPHLPGRTAVEAVVAGSLPLAGLLSAATSGAASEAVVGEARSSSLEARSSQHTETGAITPWAAAGLALSPVGFAVALQPSLTRSHQAAPLPLSGIPGLSPPVPPPDLPAVAAALPPELGGRVTRFLHDPDTTNSEARDDRFEIEAASVDAERNQLLPLVVGLRLSAWHVPADVAVTLAGVQRLREAQQSFDLHDGPDYSSSSSQPAPYRLHQALSSSQSLNGTGFGARVRLSWPLSPQQVLRLYGEISYLPASGPAAELQLNHLLDDGNGAASLLQQQAAGRADEADRRLTLAAGLEREVGSVRVALGVRFEEGLYRASTRWEPPVVTSDPGGERDLERPGLQELRQRATSLTFPLALEWAVSPRVMLRAGATHRLTWAWEESLIESHTYHVAADGSLSLAGTRTTARPRYEHRSETSLSAGLGMLLEQGVQASLTFHGPLPGAAGFALWELELTVAV